MPDKNAVFVVSVGIDGEILDVEPGPSGGTIQVYDPKTNEINEAQIAAWVSHEYMRLVHRDGSSCCFYRDSSGRTRWRPCG